MEGIKKLILGTVQLGINYGINNNIGKPSLEEAFNILAEAQKANINILDTADGYGDAIDIIADYHKNNPHFNIITKFSTSSEISISNYLSAVLEKLNLNVLYGLMFHRFIDMINFPELLNMMAEEKEKGRVRFIGVSIYTNEEFQICINNPHIDIIQLPFNLLDNFSHRGDLMIAAKTKNKIVHTRSVFLQGLFFMNTEALPPKLVPLKKNINLLKQLASDHKYSMNELALNFALHTNSIDYVLFGVENSAQLKMNLESVKEEFDPGLYRLINQIQVEEKALLNPANWE